MLRRLSTTRDDRLALHSAINVSAGALSGLLALTFRVVLSSYLTPAEFGLLYSLVATVDLALLIHGGIQLGLTRVVSGLVSTGTGSCHAPGFCGFAGINESAKTQTPATTARGTMEKTTLPALAPAESR